MGKLSNKKHNFSEQDMSEGTLTKEDYEALREEQLAQCDNPINIKECKNFSISDGFVIDDQREQASNPNLNLLNDIAKQTPGHLSNAFDNSSIASLISDNKHDITFTPESTA